MKIIIGLGNPGKGFAATRHNAGFMALNLLAEQLTGQKKAFQLSKKFNAEICQTKDFLLAKPQTFMNESGKSVKKITDFYKIKPSDIYLVHDDLDLKLGEYKLSLAKGPKQHKGVLSVEKYMKTKEFWRLRVGVENRIKEEKKLISGQNYVLQKFTVKEKQILNQVLVKAIKPLYD